jgi:type IV secretion system protein VirB6
MNVCPSFGPGGPGSIADALQKVDCVSAEATNISFERLFGPGGSLTSAFTIVLTLYVAIFALNLLTGRSSLRISALTPRMMTIGLIITFVTSWVAYQSVVWNLAVGAPDEIAGTLLGTRGASATMLFAQRLDGLFTAVTDAANQIAAAGPSDEKLASPANMLWVSSLILLLGTVGILVVCRIALAALLILGPVFIVMALFENTRGLFEGWLKSVVMFALVPLLTVVMGSGALIAIVPMVHGLGAGGAAVSLRTAVGILVGSIVYLALLLLTLEVARSLTSGWKFTKPKEARSGDDPARRTATESVLQEGIRDGSASAVATSDRVRTTIAGLNSFISSERVAAAGGAASANASSLNTWPGAVSQLAAPQERHSLYFSHRSQHGVSALPREILR